MKRPKLGLRYTVHIHCKIIIFVTLYVIYVPTCDVLPVLVLSTLFITLVVYKEINLKMTIERLFWSVKDCMVELFPRLTLNLLLQFC